MPNLKPLMPGVGGLTLLGVLSAAPALAQTNPEDQPIADAPVAAGPPSRAATAPKTPSASASSETVTIPRAVWEQLLRDVEELKRGKASSAPTSSEAAATAVAKPGENRNYLLLPDISFIANATAAASSDKRDSSRNNMNVEGEIGIQGYVYPGVKYDAFLVGNPGEDEAFNVEEGYLTFQSALKGLDINVGRKFAAFGRTGEQHPHSWLTTDQFLARQHLVAPENLVGNGVQFNYLIPTPKSFFARASFGMFGAGEGGEGRLNRFDPTDPFEGGEVTRPGAGLARFYSGRLWLGKSFGPNTEVELGASAARGRSSVVDITDDGLGNPVENTVNGRVELQGVDFQMRKYGKDAKRLLFRSEYFRYKPIDLPTSTSTGYYALANLRPNKYNDYGILYQSTEIPTAPGQKENGLSLIYTRRFSERYYMRLTGTRGDRPGENNYNEVKLQFVAGLGPHTHTLE